MLNLIKEDAFKHMLLGIQPIFLSSKAYCFTADDGEIIVRADINNEVKEIRGYTEVVYFEDAGYYIVAVKDKFGVLNDNFETVIYPKYDSIKVTKGNMLILTDGLACGLLDSNLNQVLPFIYTSINVIAGPSGALIVKALNRDLDQTSFIIKNGKCIKQDL